LEVWVEIKARVAFKSSDFFCFWTLMLAIPMKRADCLRVLPHALVTNTNFEKTKSHQIWRHDWHMISTVQFLFFQCILSLSHLIIFEWSYNTVHLRVKFHRQDTAEIGPRKAWVSGGRPGDGRVGDAWIREAETEDVGTTIAIVDQSRVILI